MTVRDQLQARPLLRRRNVSFALGLLDEFVQRLKAAIEVAPAVLVHLLAEHLKRLFYVVPVRVNDQSLTLAPASERRAVDHRRGGTEKVD
jgi:hypothetical protein